MIGKFSRANLSISRQICCPPCEILLALCEMTLLNHTLIVSRFKIIARREKSDPAINKKDTFETRCNFCEILHTGKVRIYEFPHCRSF